MSNLPPPPFGDGTGNQPPPSFTPPSFSPPGAPVGQPQPYQQPGQQFAPGGGQPPFQPGGQPPSGGGGKKTFAIIAGLVVVAGLTIGGIYIATKDDEPEVTEPTIDLTVPEITIPEITSPATTIAASTIPETVPETVPVTEPATTEEETTTTASTIPEGAIDLGGGVFVVMPSGWSEDTSSDVDTITDGTSFVALQVLERTPDEDPLVVFQEYDDTFDTDFPAVSFTQASLENEGGSVTPWVQYRQFYKTFNAEQPEGIGYRGTVYVYQRGDGLTMVIDSYGTAESVPGLPDAETEALEESFSAAPLLNDETTITRRDPFRIVQAAPFVEVERLSGFTVPPGFDIIPTEEGQGWAANPTYNFQVIKLLASADQATALADAQSKIVPAYPDAVFAAPTEQAADEYGVIQIGTTWSGTYNDGRPAAGEIDVYFDPATGNSYSILRSWFLATPGDFTEPFQPESDFMYRSFFDSFTNVP